MHDFDAMWRKKPKELVITNSNYTGTTDFCTYTCSGGAEFFLDDKKTGGLMAVFLENNASHFVTTTQIHNLDSLVVQFRPALSAATTLSVSISEDSVTWTPVTAVYHVPGARKVKIPAAGDYYVRFAWGGYNVYITYIEYYYFNLSGCPNCFLYRPE